MGVTIRRYKDGKAWEFDIRVRQADGTRIRERRKSHLKSKTATRKWAEQRAIHLAVHGADTPARRVPTFSEFFPRFIRDHCEARGHKPSGIEGKRSRFRLYIEPLLGRKRLDAITQEDVVRLRSSLIEKSASTTNNVLTILNMMLRCAVDWGVIDELPAHATLLKVSNASHRFYSDAEYGRLVEASGTWRRAHLMVLLGGDAGLRRGEMLGLQWRDSDFDNRVIRVERSVWKGQETATKGMEQRSIPMTGRLHAALAAARTEDSTTVLANGDRAPTARSIRNWLLRAQVAAGLDATGSIHILRHTFVTRLAIRGAPPHTIQRLAGHRDFKTTERYLGVADTEARRAIHLLG